ncbi:MAG: hypothetical protein U0175_12570 [Caldilineaceae bacterium]
MATAFKVGDKVEFKDFGRWLGGEIKAISTTADGKITKLTVHDVEGFDTTLENPNGYEVSELLRLPGASNGNGAAAPAANGTNGAQPANAPPPTPAQPVAPKETAPVDNTSNSGASKSGETVYFLDPNTGKWLAGKVDQTFDDAYVIDGGRLIRKSSAISEAEAKRRGVHATSTAADRAAYIDSLHAGLQQEKSGNAIIDAIVAEHNRIRRNPKGYAAELRSRRQELIKSRTEGVGNPDPVDEASRAIDTAIQDLEALEPLPPLKFSSAVSATTRQNAERGGGHTSIQEMLQTWQNAGFSRGAPAESISGLRDGGSDEEKGKEVVQGLFIDWGSNNAGQYGHRSNIIDKRLVSAPKEQVTNYTHIAVGIAQRGSVYVQYYCDLTVAGSR